MIPISDENPTLRTPIVTYAIVLAIVASWVLVQGAGLDVETLIASVCTWGIVPGEITGAAAVGTSYPMGPSWACVVDADPLNYATPVTSMFMHGGWGHLLGNLLFFWVFGNNVEDSMGRLRFIVFYVLCGLVAVFAQVVVNPASPVPMVGASGAIAGVMGAYLVLHPRVRVNMLFVFFVFIRVIPLPAWVVLLWWAFVQALLALPTLTGQVLPAQGGVAVMAHIGGFVAGAALIKLFENKALSSQHPFGGWRRR